MRLAVEIVAEAEKVLLKVTRLADVVSVAGVVAVGSAVVVAVELGTRVKRFLHFAHQMCVFLGTISHLISYRTSEGAPNQFLEVCC